MREDIAVRDSITYCLRFPITSPGFWEHILQEAARRGQEVGVELLYGNQIELFRSQCGDDAAFLTSIFRDITGEDKSSRPYHFSPVGRV